LLKIWILDIAFHGMEKAGAFDIEGTLAREWLKLPLNPNGRHNSDVLKPIRNAREITGRSADRWIIDFFCAKSEKESSFYEGPFDHVYRNVLPSRIKNNREGKRMRWWLFGENQPRLRMSISRCNRFIITPRVSKYRMFRFIDNCIIPDTRLIAFARADDAFFGILTSRYHELWSLRLCSWHGVGNDPTYTVDHVFETFPFPDGLTPNLPAEAYANDPRAERIAAVARRLNELREAWLNPPDLVVRVPEVVPGFPDRILPRDEAAAKELKTRTLTNLYNQRPAWLDHVHQELDAAVAPPTAGPRTCPTTRSSPASSPSTRSAPAPPPLPLLRKASPPASMSLKGTRMSPMLRSLSPAGSLPVAAEGDGSIRSICRQQDKSSPALSPSASTFPTATGLLAPQAAQTAAMPPQMRPQAGLQAVDPSIRSRAGLSRLPR
jgi:hypothetical protein